MALATKRKEDWPKGFTAGLKFTLFSTSWKAHQSHISKRYRIIEMICGSNIALEQGTHLSTLSFLAFGNLSFCRNYIWIVLSDLQLEVRVQHTTQVKKEMNRVEFSIKFATFKFTFLEKLFLWSSQSRKRKFRLLPLSLSLLPAEESTKFIAQEPLRLDFSLWLLRAFKLI